MINKENRRRSRFSIRRLVICLLAMVSFACGVTTSDLPEQATQIIPLDPAQRAAPPAWMVPATPSYRLPPTRLPGAPILTPTADSLRLLPTLRTETEIYIVQPGDTLGLIARRYGISLDQLVRANQIENPDLLSVGQVLTIPPPLPVASAPSFKIIPDSELVNGPVSAFFDLAGFIQERNGYLHQYQEEVDGEMLTGAQIVERVGLEYSVNPRLLLAVLEYQSGWLTIEQVDELTREYPVRYVDPYRKGLYRQLAWSANNLNRGYYLWKVNAVPAWILADGSIVTADATINAATAGVQHLFSLLYHASDWERAVGERGLFAVYQELFGYPFDFALEPQLPHDLTQPPLELPFEPGVPWSFTGGPHGGWGDGSAWAALDFAPPGNALGCVPSDAWVTAAADGLIVRSKYGVAVLDLDGDGFEQTGWTVLYLHLDSRERVAEGSWVRVGDRLGHPSCEGGVSTGTHIHLARRYNGEWISADGSIPFSLSGWVSEGTGVEYDGYLKRGDKVVEAWNGRKPENQIQR